MIVLCMISQFHFTISTYNNQLEVPLKALQNEKCYYEQTPSPERAEEIADFLWTKVPGLKHKDAVKLLGKYCTKYTCIYEHKPPACIGLECHSEANRHKLKPVISRIER